MVLVRSPVILATGISILCHLPSPFGIDLGIAVPELITEIVGDIPFTVHISKCKNSIAEISKIELNSIP